MNAVIYARYSSHNQGEQSIEGQIAAARTYAEAKGYTVVHEYIDRAQSGRTDNREEFQRMLSDCAKKQFGVIIVWKVDRFGRNRQELTFNKYRAKKHGVRVEYVAETMPEGPESVILESVLEGMAEYYSLQLSQNIQRGFAESAKKHKATGNNVPLGYTANADHEFELDPKTAPFVRQIFERYARGETAAEICRWLNESGVRTSRGGEFGRSSLHRLLANEKYIGVYRYKDLVYDEDAIPALIDRETFERVQEMRKTNKRRPNGSLGYNDYLLSGKLFCGHCGTQMLGESGVGKAGNKYAYYKCFRQKKEKSCDKKPVRADWLEKIVLEKLIPLILDDDVIDFIAQKTFEFAEQERRVADASTGLKNQIADTEKQIGNLTKAIAAGAISDAIIKQINALEAQKTALQTALAQAELKAGMSITEDQIRYFLRQFRGLDYTDRRCQQKLIDTFVSAIYLFDDHLKVIFNYGGEEEIIPLEDVKECSDSVHSAPSFETRSNTWIRIKGRLGLMIVF